MTRQQKFRKTKQGVSLVIYQSQKQHSKTRGHNLPTYSLQEFREWLYSQEKFHILFDNWKRLDYQRFYKPSVDRKEDNIGYTMDNIQLMTFRENDLKSDKDAFDGKLKRKHRAVNQYTKDGVFVKSYKSMRIAFRETDIHDTCIKDTCKGKQKTAGGFKWKYKEDTPNE